MLKVRKFVQSRDEGIWASVWNKAFKEFNEFRSVTANDIEMSEKNPSFDAAGMFIAELNGEPVGLVNAHVDKMRDDKKGFIRVLGVVPKRRRKGIGQKLADEAIKSLTERGMQTVEIGAVLERPEAKGLCEKLGFKQVRIFSLMERRLNRIASGVGENRDALLRKFRKGSEEDLKLLNWLSNEAFKEHYNYRPDAVDETQYFLEQDPMFKEQEWMFILINSEPVGYIGIGIDQKYNEEKNTRSGWILSIGVLKQNRLKGIGTRLMIEGMRRLKEKGMTVAMLGVDDQNPTKAIKLYEKVGFKATRKDAAYVKELR